MTSNNSSAVLRLALPCGTALVLTLDPGEQLPWTQSSWVSAHLDVPGRNLHLIVSDNFGYVLECLTNGIEAIKTGQVSMKPLKYGSLPLGYVYAKGLLDSTSIRAELFPFLFWSGPNSVTFLYRDHGKVMLENSPFRRFSDEDRLTPSCQGAFHEFLQTFEPFARVEIPVSAANAWAQQISEFHQQVQP